jgi:hypothetical protein
MTTFKENSRDSEEYDHIEVKEEKKEQEQKNKEANLKCLRRLLSLLLNEKEI